MAESYVFPIMLAALGGALAYNLMTSSSGANPKAVEGYPAVNYNIRRGNQHFAYALQNIWTHKIPMEDPKYWRKSKFFADLVKQAHGPASKKSQFAMHFGGSGAQGSLPGLIDRKIRL